MMLKTRRSLHNRGIVNLLMNITYLIRLSMD